MISATFIPSYIEVLAGLLILGITLPSIFITIPDRIRVIQSKHSRKITIGSKEICLGDVMKPQWIVALVVLSIMFLVGYLVPSPNILCSEFVLGLGCQLRNFFITHLYVIASGILCFNIIITALFIGVLISFSKDHLLSDLARKFRHEVNKDARHIDRTLLDSIGELGQFCNPGRDKESVLDTLANLTDLKLTFDSRVHLARTVRETVITGNERNYIHAMNILQDMSRKAFEANVNNIEQKDKEEEENNKALYLADMLHELENVMLQAFTMNNPRVRATILTGYDELTLHAPNDYSFAFFRMGKAGLRLNELRLAVAVLDKFHTKVIALLNSDGSIPGDASEVIHVFFGLLAHFWHYGNSTRQHARTYVEALANLPQWNLKCIDESMQKAKVFFQCRDIETAEYLEQMLFENNQRQFAKELLSRISRLDEVQYQNILTHYPSIEALSRTTLEGIMACGVPEATAKTIHSQCRLAVTNHF